MKITCEHCGCVIDTDKDKKCPNCGAPYSRNKEYSEVKDYKKKNSDYDLREREADIHSKELQNQIVEKTLSGINTTKKFSSFFIFIVIVIMIAIVTIGALRFTKASKTIEEERNTQQEKIEENLNKFINGKEQVTIKFNENHSSDTYEIKCDGITKYKATNLEKKNLGKMNVYNFHIVFKNKTEDWKTMNSISVTYTDDKGNEDVVAKRHSPNSTESPNELPFFAKEIVTYTGNVTVELPDYVKDVNIKFDNVLIKIDEFKNYIK